MSELPKLILIQYLPDIKKYRLIEPYFIWKGREFYPGLIIEKATYEDLKKEATKS